MERLCKFQFLEHKVNKIYRCNIAVRVNKIFILRYILLFWNCIQTFRSLFRLQELRHGRTYIHFIKALYTQHHRKTCFYWVFCQTPRNNRHNILPFSHHWRHSAGKSRHFMNFAELVEQIKELLQVIWLTKSRIYYPGQSDTYKRYRTIKATSQRFLWCQLEEKPEIQENWISGFVCIIA